MKRLRFDSIPVPPFGNAYSAKFFPTSKAGKGGPFKKNPNKPDPEPLPGDPHSEDYFSDWMKYFIAIIGGALERLNGHQFNLDKKEAASVNGIQNELTKLAVELNGKTATSPVPLHWPLAGPYHFDWNQTDANEIGYDTFTIDLYFDDEPDYRMVVNCTVQIVALDSPEEPISSSSAYLATSSSG